MAWRNALRIFKFPEIQGACLGYGVSTIHGSAWGPDLRKQVSEQIGRIWESKIHKDNAMIKQKALANKEAFTTLITTIQAADKTSYDFLLDKKGEISWMKFLERSNINYPLDLRLNKNSSIDEVFDVVQQIIKPFSFLIEDKGL